MSKVEIYLNSSQLDRLKSILNQSEQGIHILFENEHIIEAFKLEMNEDDFFLEENIKFIQDGIFKLIQLNSYYDKKNYLNSMSKYSLYRLIRAYFYMFENNIKVSQKRIH